MSEIADRGQKTAFQVRKAFQNSPSIEWSGSAGAVYPAVRRLVAAGLLDAVAQDDKRATKHLFLTPRGRAALKAWSRDCLRSVSVGIDPFRLRSGIWLNSGDLRDESFIARLRAALEERLAAEIEDQKSEDAVEAIRIELNIRLLRMRIEWLDEAIEAAAP
ncbi:PadR family transcriptional regulator [Erythrobacter sp. LQ02-29]|uniref:PadR family transcriptional regulator n=1 Tax=Erythrobacter sp. LQ02-29 TaxID=2920384 RepID=UPI001F4E152C|nr:helix-turn-helix transcriptional regulator [Erythrobacter sp. LQ02-29]MCP9222031.1 PadR family transcriptional regulator [Erythrobacter sp. LQ02-29]